MAAKSTVVRSALPGTDVRASGAPPDAGCGRPMRADAQRNRARVLEAAYEAFATEGLAVPIHEIARRAGVGTGTVCRHFPTKEALYVATFLDRIERLVARAHCLATAEDAGAAFFEFFAVLVDEVAVNRGLHEALAGTGFDIEAAISGTKHDIIGALNELLVRAQQAGAVRGDIDLADVKALMMGCMARENDQADVVARERMIGIVCEGLRARRG